MPGILLACATCIRADVLRQVGGFPADFVRQAEEYDLSFRIWDAGFCIERFEDVCYRHEKVPGNRPPADICRLDLRNNLLLVQRHLPQPWRSVYRRDWLWRYALIARANDQPGAVDQALADVRQLAAADRHRFQPVSEVALECIFEWNRQAQTVAAWAADHRIRRVVIADVGKNLYATWRACGLAGLSIGGITSDQPAFIGQSYRGIDVAGESDIDAAGADGIILSNTNPALVAHRLAALRSRFDRPVLALWQPRRVHELRQCA